MATIAERLAEAPDTSHGAPIGVDDWRLSVEFLLPSDPDNVWGVGKWGTARWDDWEWFDATSYVRGLEWFRGADEPYGRPRVGELTLTLANADLEWSPWNVDSTIAAPTAFAPGTIVRVGCRSATSPNPDISTGWLPQVCAIVDTWEEQRSGVVADRFVTVTAYEPLRDLAGIDENALTSVVGLGDTGPERIARLLEASDWRYGLIDDIGWDDSSWTVQSTDMAINRLTECYLTADSCNMEFFTHKTGQAIITSRWYQTAVGMDEATWPLKEHSWDDPSGNGGATGRPLLVFDVEYTRDAIANYRDWLHVPYDPDTVRPISEDAYIVNDARFTRVNGLGQAYYENRYSIKRFGRRTLPRTDLICQYDDQPEWLAEQTVERQGRTTLRLDEIEVATSDRGDDVYVGVIAADVGAYAIVYSDIADTADGTSRPRITGWIRSMQHQVTPRHEGGVTWRTVFAVDTWLVENIPGATLPEDPSDPDTIYP
jgi:hypothetical protein